MHQKRFSGWPCQFHIEALGEAGIGVYHHQLDQGSIIGRIGHADMGLLVSAIDFCCFGSSIEDTSFCFLG